MEHFRTGNPEIVYSGYPGAEFPKQCGGGSGFGGHGQYGTYGGCDSGSSGASDSDVMCGGQTFIPETPKCGSVVPLADTNRCGPETFRVGNPDMNYAPYQQFTAGGGCGGGCGCSIRKVQECFGNPDMTFAESSGAFETSSGLSSCGKWNPEVQSCQLPPVHCGSQSCGGSKIVETYCGDAGRFAGDSADSGCSMPYSAPYHTGPSACGRVMGPPSVTMVPMVVPSVQTIPSVVRSVLPKKSNLSNILLAILVAYIAYRLFVKGK